MDIKGLNTLRIGRDTSTQNIYHISSTTNNRVKLFNNFCAARYLINAMRSQSHAVETLCFVIMPDHFHWLFQILSEDADLSNIVQQVKHQTAFKMKAKGDMLWETGFQDHALRKKENIEGLARYIVNNPVRAGLVKSVRFYPHWDAIWV